ncbi:MAG: Crp/Fnr family transcriptional regulator [Armatimonadetes bacterium]|nr:Crp/Fnr family transcriptional regulator [Armatimonadota bacterium]
MDSYIDHLKKVSLFQDLQENTLQLLSQGCRIRNFGARDHMFHQGDPGGTVYIILSGQVSIERLIEYDDRDETIQMAIRGEGEVIGEFSLFDDIPRSADARVVTPARALILDGRYIMETLRRDDKLAASIIRVLCKKLVQQMDQKTSHQLETVRTRLVKELINLAKAMGEKDEDGVIWIKGKITQADLANRIGCKREVVNRALGEIGRDVVGSRNGRIGIYDPRALKRMAGPVLG